MNGLRIALILLFYMGIPYPVTANNDFNSGMDYAKGIKGKELEAFRSFKPEENIPSFDSNPEATKYYDGVQSSGVDLMSPGSSELNQREWGKVVKKSISKQPKEMVTTDSSFLLNGKYAEKNATTVFDPQHCEERTFETSEFTRHVCDRDLNVERYCYREATLQEVATSEKVTRNDTQKVDLHFGGEVWSGTLSMPAKGRLVHVSVEGEMSIPWNGFCSSATVNDACRRSVSEQLNIFDRTFLIDVNSYPYELKIHSGNNNDNYYVVRKNGKGKLHQAFDTHMEVSGGQGFPVTKLSKTLGSEKKSSIQVNVNLVIEEEVITHKPGVVWGEHCPFSKDEGKLTSSECVVSGGTKHLVLDGKTYSFHQDCWKYLDHYTTQNASEGSCGAYIHQPNCSVVNQQCVDQEGNACLHANITYSCEKKTKSQGQVCGNALFCSDGRCAPNNDEKNEMFAKAASELAAVTAAGKDVAAQNGKDIKVFTGKAIACRKLAVGFSNCCQDSGWGADLGLTRCSSEEQALGKAKEKRLTVYIEEFCAEKVLGVCTRKKRSYCQFDSKLAQMVQQQGRAWQLGMGFGSGKSPDCRGVTSEELQKIDFSKIDFSAFYTDLNNGSDIPADSQLMEKMKARMKAMFDQGSHH